MPALARLGGLGVAALSLFGSAAASVGRGAAGHSKRQNGNAVTGASGSTQPRLEIRQLEADADQWNLFILAIQDFQNSAHSDTMSWYQLSGIHGMPYVPWNGVQGQNQGNGYCPHSSPLFICWHRPYVALWEQQMLVHAQNVVNQFQGSDKTRYQNALATLRHPYWDWAEIPPSGNSADSMPTSISSPTLTVNTPQGTQTIPNPLYAFTHMNPHDQSDFSGIGGGDWDSWPNTLRYPTSSTDVNAQSNEAGAVQNIGNYNPQARAQVYRILTACDDFLDVSNDGVAEQNSNCGVSLESVHNGIHTFTGGQNQAGHMTYNNFAAFDPVFFLHHANVDRLFALWQSLHPNSYMPSASQGGSSTYTINANQQVDGNTPLEPFAGPDGQFWTCNSVRDVTVFHYTYPELQSGNVAQAVNSLYGSNAVPQSVSSASSSTAASTSATSASSASNSASTTGSASASGSSGSGSGSSGSGAGSTGSGSAGSTGTGSAGASSTGSGSTGSGSTGSGSTGSGSTGSGSAGSSGSGKSGSGSGASSTGSTGSSGGAGQIGGPGSLTGSASAPGSTGGFPKTGTNSTNSTTNLPGLLTPTGRTHDYTCHIVSEKHGLGGTYTIFTFLTNNTISDNPNQWLTHPDYCGAHSVFAPLGVDNKAGMLVGGQVSLTTALVGKIASGALPSIEENDVLPYLKNNLQWKVATAAGAAVPNNQVPGLTVNTVSQKVMPAANAGSLPTYGNGNTNPSVTNGKAGGVQSGMQYNWWDVCVAAPAQKPLSY